MNVLGIDHGQKNIGLAWCDTGIGAVLPFGIIKGGNLNELAKLIEDERITRVVIGLPLGLDNTENPHTALVRKFGEELEKRVVAQVVFYDERFSSAAADRMGGGVSRDEKSAMVILEDYLSSLK